MGVGGLITGIMGATGGAPSSSPPNTGRVGKDYLSLVNAYSKGAPTVFNTEQTYKPQYSDLDLSVLAKAMPSLTGMMGASSPDISALVRSINPGQTNLMDSLTRSATDQLNAGSSLDPDLTRLFQQSTRGAQASRGMGFGPSDAFNESLGLTQFGNDLRTQREQFAGNVAGMNNQYETAPALNLLTQLPQMGQAISQGSVPSIIPSSESSDLMSTAYNARAASNIGNANAQTAMMQGFNSFD
jgi:hypothetical protein